MLKYHITFLFRQFTKTFKSVYLLILDKRKLWNLYACMIWAIERIETVHWIHSLDNNLTSGPSLKNTKDHVWWKLLHVAIKYLYACHLQTAIHEVLHWIPARFQFLFVFEIKRLVFVGKILWRFDIIIHIRLIHFFFHQKFQ